MTEEEFRFQDKTVHPRQAEILKNNYNVFIDRAGRAWQQEDTQYYHACLNSAAEAAQEYKAITGKEITE